MKRSLHALRQQAFSLVEVVLAIGIIAFAVVAILGLLAVGSDQFRIALDSTVCSQIAQRIFNDAEQSDFMTLIQDQAEQKLGTPLKRDAPAPPTTYTFYNAPRYFDEEGSEIIPVDPKKLTATESLRALYVVNVRIRPTAEVPRTNIDNLKYPVLAQVTIEIARKGGNFALQYLPTNLLQRRAGMPVYTYSALVGRNN